MITESDRLAADFAFLEQRAKSYAVKIDAELKGRTCGFRHHRHIFIPVDFAATIADLFTKLQPFLAEWPNGSLWSNAAKVMLIGKFNEAVEESRPVRLSEFEAMSLSVLLHAVPAVAK